MAVNVMDLDFFKRLESGPKERIINWLKERALLADPLICLDCNTNMSMVRRSHSHVDGFIWKCAQCKKKKSLRKGSLFEAFPKVTLGKCLLMMYFWTLQNRRNTTATALGVSANLVTKFFRRLEEVCSNNVERFASFLPFGGPGHVVMCDESQFSHKSKNHRGRRAEDLWVWGAVTTEYSPARGYYQVVDNRERETLLPLLRKCLKPRSTLWTDEFGSYRDIDRFLPQQVQRHRVVNHSLSFVDPVTGVHTQNIESKWSSLKLELKAKKGISREDMQTYLDVSMYREWNGRGDQFMYNFFGSVALAYPC